jgi:hypothetical protein
MTTAAEPELRLLTALLLNDFEVHAIGCADIKRTVAKGKVQNQFNFRAADEHDAVYELYSDQIDESVGDQYPDEETAISSYASAVKFHPCCKLQWNGSAVKAKPVSPSRQRQTAARRKQAANMKAAKSTADRNVKAAVLRQRAKDKPATKAAKLTREQKRQLAHVIMTAADSVMDQLDGVGLKGVDQDEAAKVVAQWLHHLPVDQGWFVTNMKYLPKPDRSDWR